MALRKDEVEQTSEAVVAALANSWEQEIDDRLRLGERRFVFSTLGKLRMMATGLDHLLARQEVGRRYQAAGWTVAFCKSMDPSMVLS